MWGPHIAGAFLIGWLVKLYTAWMRHRPWFSYGTMVVVSPEQWGWPVHSLEKVLFDIGPARPNADAEDEWLKRQSRLRHTQGFFSLESTWSRSERPAWFRAVLELVGCFSPSLELFVEQQIYRMSQFRNILELAPPKSLTYNSILQLSPFTPEAQSSHLRHLCSSSWRNGTIENMWQNGAALSFNANAGKWASALCGIDFSKILMPSLCISSPSRSGYQGSSFGRLVSEYHSQFHNTTVTGLWIVDLLGVRHPLVHDFEGDFNLDHRQ